MTSDDFDAYDDAVLSSEPPVLRPLRPEEMSLEELRAKYLKPGFGFWMAVVWCMLYLVVTQILAGLLLGIPIIGIALIPEFQQNGMEVLNDPAKLNAWMAGPDGRIATLILVAATQFTGLAFSVLLLRLRCGKTWKHKIALTRLPSGTHCLLVLLGIPAVLAVGSAIEVPINRYLPSIQEILDALNINFKFDGSEALRPLLKHSPILLAIFAVAISPGICEEMFCRGFLANGLAGRYHTWMVVVITSFLFGCLHMDPRQGLGAALLGAAIHGAYLATRSLVVAMFIHFANNGMAVIHFNEGLAFPILEPLEETMKGSPALFVLSGILFFGAVAYALYQTRCRLAPLEPGMPTWEPKGVSSVELPPPNSGTVVTHDPISTLSVALVLAGAVIFGMVLAFA